MAIPLIYLLRKSKAVALFVIAAIMSASTILRYQAVVNNNLATVVYFGSEYASYLLQSLILLFNNNYAKNNFQFFKTL